MRRVLVGPTTAFVVLLALYGLLSVTAGLVIVGWAVGLVSALLLCGLLARALLRSRKDRLGPADRVTLSRGVLVCLVAAMVADSFAGAAPVRLLVVVAAVALVLDAVDGRVARRTGTVSALGARFDMEVDAFLILALSAYVAASLGSWVLAIGAARYAFLGAGLVWPWLRAEAPPRRWCKVVAAAQGVALTTAASGVLPLAVARVVVAVALLLLAESFGREAWQLWSHGGGPASESSGVRELVRVGDAA